MAGSCLLATQKLFQKFLGSKTMLLWLTEQLTQYDSFFSVFEYLTFRTLVSFITALLLSMFLGPSIIRRFQRAQIGEVIRDDGPTSHQSKAGTPTMGGTMIIVVWSLTTLLWGDLSNRYIWLALFVVLSFGLIGWTDDYLKIKYRNSLGLSAGRKIFVQSVFAALVALYLYSVSLSLVETSLFIPFFKDVMVPLGLGFLILASLMIVGMSNAVNLTDGLDGLAILPSVLVMGALGLIAYLCGNVEFATYLQIPYIPGAGELAIFCGGLIGAGLGFLWFNTYPAQIFMGDVGALPIGASIGFVAVVVRHEIVALVMGGLFVIETASVIIQVASYKLTGKRIFRMAPIHHHFELKGWPEPRVIVRFWIITVMLVLFGLATLKLR